MFNNLYYKTKLICIKDNMARYSRNSSVKLGSGVIMPPKNDSENEKCHSINESWATLKSHKMKTIAKLRNLAMLNIDIVP